MLPREELIRNYKWFKMGWEIGRSRMRAEFFGLDYKSPESMFFSEDEWDNVKEVLYADPESCL